MTLKFYIHWKSNHVLKMDKRLQISEYCSYNISDEEHSYVYHIPNGYISSITALLTDAVNEHCIFTSDVRLYYFDGTILQYGLGQIYNMQKVRENVFFCDHLFLIVDKKSTLYLLEIDRMDQILNEMSHYYPITELLFLHAKSCIKLYKWKSLYDKVLTVQINEKSNIVKFWINAENTHVLLLNPLNYLFK